MPLGSDRILRCLRNGSVIVLEIEQQIRRFAIGKCRKALARPTWAATPSLTTFRCALWKTPALTLDNDKATVWRGFRWPRRVVPRRAVAVTSAPRCGAGVDRPLPYLADLPRWAIQSWGCDSRMHIQHYSSCWVQFNKPHLIGFYFMSYT
jgi:hypothetical protein